LTAGQVDPMPLHDLQQSIVLDFPERLVGLIFNQEPEVRQQLAEPHVGREMLKLEELPD
jgi:hypothetical protein